MTREKTRDLQHTPAFLAAMNDKQLASMAELKPEQIAALVFLRRQKLKFQTLCDQIIRGQKYIKNVGLALIAAFSLFPCFRALFMNPPEKMMYTLESIMVGTAAAFWVEILFRRFVLKRYVVLSGLLSISAAVGGVEVLFTTPDTVPLAWICCLLIALPAYFFLPTNEFGQVAPDLKKEFNKAIREAHKFRKDDLEALPLKSPAGMAIPLCLGTTAEGQEVWEDFAEIPHLLVGGTTGAGKTNVLNLMINGLMDKVDLCMVDPTCAGGAKWSRLPGVRYHDEDGAQAIADFKAEDVRAKELRNARAYDITEYNAVALHPWRRQVLMVDEFPQLPKSAIADLKAIGQLGRKVGCHLIISTQRVNARTVDRDISTMFGAVVAQRRGILHYVKYRSHRPNIPPRKPRNRQVKEVVPPRSTQDQHHISHSDLVRGRKAAGEALHIRKRDEKQQERQQKSDELRQQLDQQREQKRQEHERKRQNAERRRELFGPRRKSRPITDRIAPPGERDRDPQDHEANPDPPQPEVEGGSQNTPEAIPSPEGTGQHLPDTPGPQPNEEGRDTQGNGCGSGKKKRQSYCSDHIDYSLFGTAGHQLVKRQVEEVTKKATKTTTQKVFKEITDKTEYLTIRDQLYNQGRKVFKASIKDSDLEKMAKTKEIRDAASSLFYQNGKIPKYVFSHLSKDQSLHFSGEYSHALNEAEVLADKRSWLFDPFPKATDDEQIHQISKVLSKHKILHDKSKDLMDVATKNATKQFKKTTSKIIKEEGGKTLIEVGERTTSVPVTHVEVIPERLVKLGVKKMASGLGMTYVFSGLGTVWRLLRGEYQKELKDKTVPEKAKVVVQKMYDESPPLLKAVTDNAVSIAISNAMVAGVTYLGYKTEGWKFGVLSAVGSIGISIAKGRLFDHLWYQREGMNRLKKLKIQE